MDIDVKREILLVVGDAVNSDFYPWGHDLVPSVDAPNKPSATLETSSPAERVSE